MNLDEVKKRWTEKIKEIKKSEFDKDQSYSVYLLWHQEFLDYFMHEHVSDNDALELKKIGYDLELALEMAFSNFRKNKKGFWAKLFSGKKELNLIKYK